MKHCILVKWNENVKDKNEIAIMARAVFDKLLEIDGVYKIEYRHNCVDRENRFDFLICIEMDRKVLPVYDSSSPHLEWKQKFGKFVEKKAIFDFEE